MSNAWRATLFLSAFFFAFGFQLPYLPAWLEAVRGLSGAQIGVAVFGASVLRIAAGPLSAAYADSRNARAVLVRMTGLITVGFLVLLFPGPDWLVMMSSLLAGVVVYSTMPLGEAALLLSAGKDGPGFGLGRAIGSVLFIAGVLIGGVLKDVLGITSIVPALALFYGISMLAAFLAPDLPMGDAGRASSFVTRLRKGAEIFARPSLFLMLMASGFMLGAHAFYYGFSVVIWEAQGVSGAMTGALWSIGVAAEVALLSLSSRLPRWLTPQRLILAAGVASVVRWLGLAYDTGLVATFALQSLHGLTFAAAFIGAIQVIDRDVIATDKTSAMSFQASMTAGGFTGLIGIASGLIYESMGMRGYLPMAALGLAGLVCAVMLMVRVAARPPGRELGRRGAS